MATMDADRPDILKIVMRRLDEFERRVDQRHQDNQEVAKEQRALLHEIRAETKATNGRMNQAEKRLREFESDITWLKREIEELFKRVARRAGGITQKDVVAYAAVIAAVWYILTQVLGYHR